MQNCSYLSKTNILNDDFLFYICIVEGDSVPSSCTLGVDKSPRPLLYRCPYKLLLSWNKRSASQVVISSYLQNQPISTYVNDTFSDRKIFTEGVPQGGVLNPTLYNTYLHNFSSLYFIFTHCFLKGNSLAEIQDSRNLLLCYNKIIKLLIAESLANTFEKSYKYALNG